MSEESNKSIDGYKVLSQNQTNMFGKFFEEGYTYQSEGNKYLKGYYFGKKLSDALAFSYLVSLTRNIKVAKVTGVDCILDKDKIYYGDYYDITDIYFTPRITINSFLTYDDIIEQMNQESEAKLNLYFANLNLEREDIANIIAKYQNNYYVMYLLLYHQLGSRDIYEVEADEARKRIKDVVERWTK